MTESGQHVDPVLLVGSNKLTYSIALCLQTAGHSVVLITPDIENAKRYLVPDAGYASGVTSVSLRILTEFNFQEQISLAIAVTDENLSAKKSLITTLEGILPDDTLIAINTESIPLREIQLNAKRPYRILGANWVEPADTTFFLEIIANEISRKSLVDNLYHTARNCWRKDPYIINGDSGIRMRLFAAMLREAFYLIKNDYANVEDIDRACRNDAGYYLPFAGNLRYMDLMGTNAYGMVMKDLNPELARDNAVPDFFHELIQNDHLGMESGRGFYEYQSGEKEKWEALMNRFSHQISDLIEKYPFKYKDVEADQDLSAVHSENRL